MNAINALRAQVFKALGNPVRMALVQELLAGERCVCDLAQALGGNMPAVSKHLATLREAGIVSCRREGTTIHYSLAMACVAGFLHCVDGHLRREAARLADDLADDLDRRAPASALDGAGAEPGVSSANGQQPVRPACACESAAQAAIGTL